MTAAGAATAANASPAVAGAAASHVAENFSCGQAVHFGVPQGIRTASSAEANWSLASTVREPGDSKPM